MLCRFLLAVALAIIVHSDAAVNSARVTFNTVAFPSAGESLKLVVQSLHDDPILVQMKHKAPYPIYTASISMKDTLTARYEYVIIRADNTTLHETALFGSSGVARVLKSVGPEMSTMNEFFGEIANVYDLAPLPATVEYPRAQQIEPHTIYNESMVSTVSITVDPSSWDHFIKASSKPKGYFGPTLAKPQIKGSYTFVNPQHSYHAESVEIVLAGFGSLTQKKKSYNVHFGKKDAKEWGLKKHKIKAYTYDPSLMRETASVDLLRTMALPVHRVAWTRLWINGQNMGVYNNLEYISNKYLHERFPDSMPLPDGTIYKCDDKAYMTSQSVTKCNLDQTAAESNSTNWQDLSALVDIFTNTSDAEFATKIDAVFDVQQFINASAVELTMLRRDGYYDDGSNYILWLNPATKKWTYVAWDFEIDMFDMDVMVFDKAWSFFKKPFMNTTVLPGYVPQVPMSRILTVPAWRQQYVEMVKKTLAVMQSSEMELRLSKLHSMVKPLVANDPLYSADMAYTLNDFDAAFESRVLKSKFDIGFKRVFGWSAGLPDLFHNGLLDVELIGLKPFMKQRAEIVANQLAAAGF